MMLFVLVVLVSDPTIMLFFVQDVHVAGLWPTWKDRCRQKQYAWSAKVSLKDIKALCDCTPWDFRV